MKPLRIALLCALLMLASSAGFLAGNWSKATRAQARYEATEQWEYCALSRSAFIGSQNRPGVYWISYFNDGGVKVETFQENATERNGMARAIAKLGTQGWELVGAGKLDVRAGEPIEAMYFKRQRQ